MRFSFVRASGDQRKKAAPIGNRTLSICAESAATIISCIDLVIVFKIGAGRSWGIFFFFPHCSGGEGFGVQAFTGFDWKLGFNHALALHLLAGEGERLPGGLAL